MNYTGKVSLWMKVGKVVPRMLRRLETSYERLYNTKPWLFSNDSSSEYSDGVGTMVRTFITILYTVFFIWSSLILMRRKIDHTVVSVIKGSSVTLLTWQKEPVNSKFRLRQLSSNLLGKSCSLG